MTDTMYTIAILLLMPGMMIILAAIVAIPLTLIQLWDEWDERRKRIRALEAEYAEWYGRYEACDRFGGAIDKGRAAAMCVVLRHEIEITKGGQNTVEL